MTREQFLVDVEEALHDVHDMDVTMAQYAASVVDRVIMPTLPVWRPIESAPKDGTHFLAYWPDYIGNKSAAQIETWFCGSDGEERWETAWFGFATWDIEKPTHWAPLPEPPKEDAR